MDWDDDIVGQASAAWQRADKSEQETALEDASAFIDREFKFRGEPQTEQQMRSWPRKNAHYDDGSPILGVPAAAKEATALIAGFMIANVPMDVNAVAHVFAILIPIIEKERLH